MYRTLHHVHYIVMCRELIFCPRQLPASTGDTLLLLTASGHTMEQLAEESQGGHHTALKMSSRSGTMHTL